MTECPTCGSTTLHDITELSEANRRYLCGNGHLSQHVEFRRAERYVPPLLYMDPRDMPPMVATFNPGPAPVQCTVQPHAVHCGPAAAEPRVPTPEEILQGAGLGYLVA